MEETYQIVETAIDYAFDGRYVLDFYQYLKSNKVKRYEVEQFIESSTAANLSDMVLQLEGYLKGGEKELVEAYGYLSKSKARQIKRQLSELGLGRIVYEATGNIGKGYRRHDEAGTPFCITIDFQTIEQDGSVTIRDRDTMKQERVSEEGLVDFMLKHISSPSD